jgi:hypothetical protein
MYLKAAVRIDVDNLRLGVQKSRKVKVDHGIG